MAKASTKITVLYVGSSLLASLRQAEREINAEYDIDLTVATFNCTLPLDDAEWVKVEHALATSDIVFVIHVTDSENALRIASVLDNHRSRHRAVIVINCLRDLMRRTRLGRLDFSSILRSSSEKEKSHPALKLMSTLGSWMVNQMKSRQRKSPPGSNGQYLSFAQRIPQVLRFVPATGRLRDIKHYLTLFCYFLQPTPGNIRSMLLYAIKHYLPGYEYEITMAAPETRPSVGIYHPDAPTLFASFDDYREWYDRRTRTRNRESRIETAVFTSDPRPATSDRFPVLDSSKTIGLLLLRPQIMSGARQHYDGLIRALEAEDLPVLPIISTFMDNRAACQSFFIDPVSRTSRVSQILSLTGFSFVGGPAANDSEAAIAYLKQFNRPYHTALSLEMQTIEQWSESMIGLNPVQTAMQIAIPEIDGATEPFIFGGTRQGRDQPEALEHRARRIARRFARWNRLSVAPRPDLRLAFLIYCFPPNKGNLGTAADLDVFPSLWDILQRLNLEGYSVELPENADTLRVSLTPGLNPVLMNIAYRLSVDEYFNLCPYIKDISAEWGPPPGQINSSGQDILIFGVQLGHVFIGVQPTFGYEGDPMRMMMAAGGAPHHGFMGLYTYLDRIFRADALIHVGTHGALEFMPGKQAGLSDECWPDRLIGEFPNIYIYSVNNPSEGTIAKRRSYAELISYLTPPIANAGLYKGLAALKELVTAYRQTRDESQRERLFAAIDEKARSLNIVLGS